MRDWLERLTQSVFVVLGRVLVRLLPDRIPVTFVGADAVREMAESIGHQGIGRVLVVTDAGLVDVGLVERVTDQLTAAGVEWSVFAEVEPDPTFDQVEAGTRQYRVEGCEAVVAVGGGSPMDAAKVISAAATNDRPPRKLVGKFRVRTAPAPLFAVPTTAGTGSEVTVAAVVSDPVTHAKEFILDPKLLPDMAALDPTLMVGLPPFMTAATGMDALTHAIEASVSKAATRQTDTYAQTAVRLIFEHLPTAYADGSDLDARKGMALASYYAGLAFTRTSVGYVHAIAHNLGATYGTPHGLANAIALPLVLDFSKREAEPELAGLADLIGLGGSNDADKAEAFIAAVRELTATLQIPARLDALQVDDIPSLAERARAEAFLDYAVPRFMDQSQCETVLRRMTPAPAA